MPIRDLVVVIYAHDEASYVRKQFALKRSHPDLDNIIWCDSRNTNRLEVLYTFADSWVLFLDYDCEPAKDFFKTISKIIFAGAPLKKTVFAGSYLNPAPATYLQRSHNFTANQWLKQSFGPIDSLAADVKVNAPNILGGVFLTSPGAFPSIQLHQQNPIFWGAEDLWLAQRLHSQNIDILETSGLAVIHHTTKTMRHFIKRAWLQGVNHAKFIKPSSTSVKAKYGFWLRHLAGPPLVFAPAILVHFCIQKLAQSIQQARQWRKPLW